MRCRGKWRYIETACNLLLHFDRQVAVDILRLVQCSHDGALFILEALDDCEELLMLLGSIGKRNGTDTLLHFISSLIKLSLNSGMVRSAPLLGGELSYIFMNYIKIDIRNNSKKELKTKVCQTHDEIFVSSFSVQHKNFVFGHL
mgnify:FL=1